MSGRSARSTLACSRNVRPDGVRGVIASRYCVGQRRDDGKSKGPQRMPVEGCPRQREPKETNKSAHDQRERAMRSPSRQRAAVHRIEHERSVGDQERSDRQHEEVPPRRDRCLRESCARFRRGTYKGRVAERGRGRGEAGHSRANQAGGESPKAAKVRKQGHPLRRVVQTWRSPMPFLGGPWGSAERPFC